MKKGTRLFFVTGVFCLLSFLTFSQQTACGIDYYDSFLKSNDTNYLYRATQSELNIQDTIGEHHYDSLFGGRYANIDLGVVKIPVVFHLLGTNVSGSVSFFTIQNMINSLNDMFRKKIGTTFAGEGVDTEIQFCLATKDENNNTSTGVLSVSGSYGPYCKNDNDDAALKNLSKWNPAKYLNVWVCDVGTCTDKAWGSLPAMYFTNTDQSKKYRDGVVCDKNVMANMDVKLLGHEIGHWLNLKHTFGDSQSACGSSGNDDGCSDTPWCTGSAASFNCNTINHQCTAENAGDDVRQIENYMDDSDESCKNMFTAQQKVRMHLTLTNIRSGILNSSAICPVTCDDGILNGSETGIDCGGSCPACNNPPPPNNDCYTIKFKINNQSTDKGRFINVCKGYSDIIISPDCDGDAKWKFTSVWRKLDDPDPNGFNCWQVMPVIGKWWCNYSRLFVSIEETDENRNRMPNTELANWFDVDRNMSAFSLHDFLYYLGNPLVDGKHFRITIATTYNNWESYSAYIKVYENNLTITNKSISKSEVSDNITINNCYVAGGLDLNIVAKNSIAITPNTEVNNRVNLFIQNFSCGQQISGYRPMSDGPSKGQFSNAAYTNANYQPAQAKNETKLETDKVLIVPNPSSTGIFKVNSLADKKITKVIVLDLTGQVIATFDSEIIDITKYSQGVYFAEVFFSGEKITKKLIYQ